MPESVQSCFELSIHFPVFFSRELFLVAVLLFQACLPTRQNGVENRDKAYLVVMFPFIE